jgi:hypothetical protein
MRISKEPKCPINLRLNLNRNKIIFWELWRPTYKADYSHIWNWHHFRCAR